MLYELHTDGRGAIAKFHIKRDTTFIDPSGEIQVAGGEYVWKYPFQGKDVTMVFGPPPDDHLDFVYPATRLAEAALMMPNCRNAFNEACGKKFPGVFNVGQYLGDRTTVYYASPANSEGPSNLQPGGAEGIGTTSNAVPISNPPNEIAVAYAVEATLAYQRKAISGLNVGREYFARVIVHEIAHYAGVLGPGDSGGVVIDLSNARKSERTVQSIVTECFRFIP